MAEPVTLYLGSSGMTTNSPNEAARLRGEGWSTTKPNPPTNVVESRPGDGWDALSINLRRALSQAGYRSADDVNGATDDELLAISGIGGKALALLRKTLG